MNDPDGTAIGIHGFVVGIDEVTVLVDAGGGFQGVFRVVEAPDDSGQEVSQDGVGSDEAGVVF